MFSYMGWREALLEIPSRKESVGAFLPTIANHTAAKIHKKLMDTAAVSKEFDASATRPKSGGTHKAPREFTVFHKPINWLLAKVGAKPVQKEATMPPKNPFPMA
jgi:hypothetical protein